MTKMMKTKMSINSKGSFLSNFKELDLELHGVRLPSFEIENDHKRKLGLSEDLDNYEFLRELCKIGFKKLNLKRGSKEHKEYSKRTRYELATLKELGFIDYVLLVWDVVNYCKLNDIPTGLGRGSAAGSLVLYFAEVTKIDPVKYGLYFERFVSKIRAKKRVVDGVTYLDGSLMCDVDLDICYWNRQKVIEYIDQKFEGKTCKILTLNTLSTKLLLKECGKIIAEKTEAEMNRVSSMVPKVFGQVKDLRESYEEVEELREWCDDNKETYNIALKLRGLAKNKGVHPSAVSISHDKMDDSCPTELTSDKKGSVSSFDMNWVSLFNVKLDVLGLRSLSVVDDACKKIGIEFNNIDLNDDFIYQQLQELRTPHGLFQIEADTNFRVCQKVKPKNLEELSAVLALARPGALAFVDKYANYTNHDIKEGIHPFFDDILSSTGGVCLYQEQMMQMAHKVGFTLDEAEILRRIVGKKKVIEVRKWKKKIREKVQKSNLDPEVGDVLWNVLEDSANYSFNKAHSISYAALAAITIYLKFKHPKDFFLSLLKMTRYEQDPIGEINKISKEMGAFNIKLLPPHLIKSNMDFSIEGSDIRFGLLSIKGISDKSIQKLNDFKNEYSTKFEVFQAAHESGLGIGILSALIQAGAFEGGFKQSRTKVVYEAQVWNILTDREKKIALNIADEHENDLVKIIKAISILKNEKGKDVIRESRLGTIKRKSQPYKQIYNQNKISESFANWFYENELLGYTYGKTLRDIFLEKKPQLTHVNSVDRKAQGSRVWFIGRIEEKPYKGISRTAKKSRYLRVKVGDETGSIKVMIFNQKMDDCKKINDRFPAEKDIVIVNGQKMDEGTIFADVMSIQNNKIYTKLSEIKNL